MRSRNSLEPPVSAKCVASTNRRGLIIVGNVINAFCGWVRRSTTLHTFHLQGQIIIALGSTTVSVTQTMATSFAFFSSSTWHVRTTW